MTNTFEVGSRSLVRGGLHVSEVFGWAMAGGQHLQLSAAIVVLDGKPVLMHKHPRRLRCSTCCDSR